MKRESERGGHAWVMRNAVEPNHLILSSDLAFRRVTRDTTVAHEILRAAVMRLAGARVSPAGGAVVVVDEEHASQGVVDALLPPGRQPTGLDL